MVCFSYKEKIVYDIGYRINNGKIFSGKTGKEIKYKLNNRGYPIIRVSIIEDTDGVYRKINNVSVHRLVAYQKYGDKIYESGIVVRHLDGNPLNFLEDNIAIGTMSDNIFDIPKDIRIRSAKAGSCATKIFSDLQIIEMRALYTSGNYTYRNLCEKYGVGKSHISMIINRKIYADI